MRVRSILERRGWRATHGLRELDVSATRVWTSKRETRAHVTLLVECKSFQKPQLLAQQRNTRTPDPLYHHWLGIDDRVLRAEIRKIVDDAKLDVPGVMARFESMLYPRGAAIINPLLVSAPKAACRASGIRDSNGDDSCATRQVFAALQSTIEEATAAALEEARDGLELRASPGDDTIDYAARVLRMAASDVLLFHPIVSVESPLMLVSERGQLTNVPWCRVERGRVVGADRQWIDVVSADAFEEYAAMITSWYERALSAK